MLLCGFGSDFVYVKFLRPMSLGRGGGGVLGLLFAGYVPLASQSPYPIIVYFLANYRPHLSHCLVNVIFTIPTKSLSIYASTLSMWFHAAAWNAVNASLLLNLINNNFLIFLTKILPILSLYLPPKSKNLRPHSSNSVENATPL